MAAGLCLAVFILTSSVVIVLNLTPLYYGNIDRLGIVEYSGIPQDEVIENYKALIKYNSIFNNEPLKLTLPMSTEGRIHFEETRDIFTTVQWLAVVSGIGVIGFGLFFKPRREYEFLKYGGAISLALPVVTGAFIAVNWEAAFVTFHKLFFRNSYWIFDPELDPIINILPSQFFMYCAFAIIGLVLGFSTLAYLIYKKKTTIA